MATRFSPGAHGTARLQANAVSKNVGGLASWLAQADNPGTALRVGGCPRPGEQNYRGREGAILTPPPPSKKQCLLEALTGK